VPVTENDAYFTRAKQLNTEVETGFASHDERIKTEAAMRPGSHSKRNN